MLCLVDLWPSRKWASEKVFYTKLWLEAYPVNCQLCFDTFSFENCQGTEFSWFTESCQGTEFSWFTVSCQGTEFSWFTENYQSTEFSWFTEKCQGTEFSWLSKSDFFSCLFLDDFPKWTKVLENVSKPMKVLTGEPTFFKTYAKQDSVVLRMTKADFYSLMADYPKVVLNLAHTVVSRLSPFVR